VLVSGSLDVTHTFFVTGSTFSWYRSAHAFYSMWMSVVVSNLSLILSAGRCYALLNHARKTARQRALRHRTRRRAFVNGGARRCAGGRGMNISVSAQTPHLYPQQHGGAARYKTTATLAHDATRQATVATAGLSGTGAGLRTRAPHLPIANYSLCSPLEPKSRVKNTHALRAVAT